MKIGGVRDPEEESEAQKWIEIVMNRPFASESLEFGGFFYLHVIFPFLSLSKNKTNRNAQDVFLS